MKYIIYLNVGPQGAIPINIEGELKYQRETGSTVITKMVDKQEEIIAIVPKEALIVADKD